LTNAIAFARSHFSQNNYGGKMATLSQLESQIQKLQRRADALREKKSAEVIANIKALMQEHGLSIADLDQGGKRRGRPAGTQNGVKKTVKAANNHAAKGKLPPKYRDPVSGLTWSGHARPPAWIKDAPDRDAFLIARKRGRPASNGGAAKKA
jgi:DNA-binding protein H-NS